MRKIFFSAASLMLALPAIVSAGNPEPVEFMDADIICQSVYYGSEASNHANNPCKGATIRKCAELTEQIIDKTDYSIVVMEMLDDSGRVLSTDQQQVFATPEQILQIRITSLPENAEFNIIKRR